MISGFRHKVDENYILLGCYAVSCGNTLRTFQDNLSVPLRPIGYLSFTAAVIDLYLELKTYSTEYSL